MSRPRILAVVGMQAEARLLARYGVEPLVGGGDAARLATALDDLLSSHGAGGVLLKGERGAPGAIDRTLAPSVTTLLPAPASPLRRAGEGFSAILSFGVAGGLYPGLSTGGLVLGTEIWSVGSAGRALGADVAWVERLAAALPVAVSGPIVGQDHPAVSAAEKAGLFSATAALAIDMESHVVAQAAHRYGLPFAVIRAISDPAERSLPPAALAGFGAEGRADVGAVLRSLARDPRQLGALIRTGTEASRAFQTLKRTLGALRAAGLL